MLLKAVVLATTLFVYCHSASDKILLKNVEALTLHINQKTTGRRSRTVDQLTLKGGSAAKHHGPLSVVQCYNRGHDGYDVQWECVANLPNNVKFGAINVQCEGYDYPDDPYILKGSCGLEYSLDFVSEPGSQHIKSKSSEEGGVSLFWIIVLIAIAFFIYTLCTQKRRTTQSNNPPPYSETSQQSTTRNRLYPDIPPPAYPGTEPSAPPEDSHTGYGWAPHVNPGYTSTANSGSRTHTIFDQPTHTHTRTESNSQSGSGYWSGFTTGGVLGYLFGNSNRGGQYHHQPHYGHQSQSWWGSSGSWGPSYNSGYASSSSRRSSSEGTGYSKSSGFGGTSRR